MRLKIAVLLGTGGIVALSIWWGLQQSTSDTDIALSQEVQQTPSPEARQQSIPSLAGGETLGPVSMDRSTLRTRPLAAPAIDLSGVHELDDSAKRFLAERGFVVIPLTWNARVASTYISFKSSREPVLVTTDAALHVSHLVMDWCLRFLEVAHLYDDLSSLTDSLLAQMMSYADEAPTEELRRSALDCACYLTVAKRLLAGGDTAGIPGELAEKIEGKLRLIERAAGFVRSPLFGYKEDYSQYKPRGHYSRSEKFQRYFRTMMWLGRMRFLVQPSRRSPEFGGLPIEDVRHQTRQALLLCKALKEVRVKGESALRVWRRIYETTRLFAGPSDDLTPQEFAPAIARVYGESPSLNMLADDNRLERFREEAEKLRPPRILSTYSLSTDAGPNAWRSETKGLALLGQRFSLDSSVLQELTFDRVGVYIGPTPPPPITAVNTAGGLIRGFPLGLDLLSAFGSPEAEEIIRSNRDDRYEAYPAQLRTVRTHLANLPEGTWVSDLYSTRLDAIRRCLADPDSRAPGFMRSKTWLLKQHQTALGAWTELRHDTILYAKQLYPMAQAAMAGVGKGGPPRPPPKVVKGYVEPYPQVYRAISNSLKRINLSLSELGYPEDRALSNNLTECAGTMARLADIADKELARTDLTENEYKFIERIGYVFSAMLRFPHYWDVTDEFQSDVDKEMPIVADVATNVDAREVLEEAVGWPMKILAICPVAGKPTLCRGITYSYYEFRQPTANRLTDEQWRKMLKEGDVPARPAWTLSFIGKRSSRAQG